MHDHSEYDLIVNFVYGCMSSHVQILFVLSSGQPPGLPARRPVLFARAATPRCIQQQTHNFTLQDVVCSQVT